MKNIRVSNKVNNIAPYEWESNVDQNAMRFDTNTLPFPPPGVRQFAENIRTSCLINEYTDPSTLSLKQSIALYEGVSQDNITITNSGDEAIDIIAKAFLNTGDKFIVTPPTYEMFTLQSIKNGGIPLEIPLLQATYALQTNELIAQSKKRNVNVLFLCNPNNPTGSVIPEDELLRIIKNASCIVIVDEVYREFYGKSVVKYLDRFGNLIVLRSLSKFTGLAGARIGYLVSSPMLSRLFDAIKLPMGVSYLSNLLAQTVLTNNQRWMKNQVTMLVRERQRLTIALTKLGFFVYPSQANFLLVNMGNDAKKISDALKAKGLLVRDRSQKPFLTNCVRITVRSRYENTKLLQALKEIL
jgi:histidinol-phosphate aminotransferase